jgi:hypothetical protein
MVGAGGAVHGVGPKIPIIPTETLLLGNPVQLEGFCTVTQMVHVPLIFSPTKASVPFAGGGSGTKYGPYPGAQVTKGPGPLKLPVP